MDVLLTDVQMCSVQFGSHDSDFGHVGMTKTAVHNWIPVKIKSKWLPVLDLSFPSL